MISDCWIPYFANLEVYRRLDITRELVPLVSLPSPLFSHYALCNKLFTEDPNLWVIVIVCLLLRDSMLRPASSRPLEGVKSNLELTGSMVNHGSIRRKWFGSKGHFQAEGFGRVCGMGLEELGVGVERVEAGKLVQYIEAVGGKGRITREARPFAVEGVSGNYCGEGKDAIEGNEEVNPRTQRKHGGKSHECWE